MLFRFSRSSLHVLKLKLKVVDGSFVLYTTGRISVYGCQELFIAEHEIELLAS